MNNKKNKLFRLFSFIMGVTFIMSGIFKSMSIRSFSNIIQKYIDYYLYDFQFDTPLWIAVLVCSFEILLGVLTLYPRISSMMGAIYLPIMLFFTILTGINYLDPYAQIESCGCFGEIIHMSPFASFVKSIFLLGISIFMFNHSFKIMRKELVKKCVIVGALFLPTYNSHAQDQISLQTAIKIAQERSFDAQRARLSFLAGYWSYRSFKAELLPSVNLYGELMNFDHSIVETRNYETGQVNYVNNNSMSNNLTFSIDQEVVATGGKISLQSYLYRLDQFSYDLTTYNSQPLRMSYTQPLRAFNSLKWKKKIAPVEYEIAQRNYLTNMEQIALTVTDFFFNALAAQWEYKQSLVSLADRETLFKIAEKRLTLGTTTKSEVLQLELSLINARVAVNKQKLVLEDQLYQLYSYLRVNDYDGVELTVPDTVPKMQVDIESVLQKALENSPYPLEKREELLQAEKALAQAKANKGVQMTLRGEVGFTKSSNDFSDAYSRLKENEIVGLTLSLPIFDWGVSKGLVKVSKAQLEIIRTKQEQEYEDYIQILRKKVMEFNLHPTLCKDALRALDISVERYDITRRRFEAGTVSVTELNTAQHEKESARVQYVNQIRTFWADYFTLQKYTLYDWIEKREITADFNNLVK